MYSDLRRSPCEKNGKKKKDLKVLCRVRFLLKRFWLWQNVPKIFYKKTFPLYKCVEMLSLFVLQWHLDSFTVSCKTTWAGSIVNFLKTALFVHVPHAQLSALSRSFSSSIFLCPLSSGCQCLVPDVLDVRPPGDLVSFSLLSACSPCVSLFLSSFLFY